MCYETKKPLEEQPLANRRLDKAIKRDALSESIGNAQATPIPTTMRAKMRVGGVIVSETTDELTLYPVGPSQYPSDGSDENNSYARWSPSGELKLTVSNPELFGKFRPGQEYYLDFTRAK